MIKIHAKIKTLAKLQMSGWVLLCLLMVPFLPQYATAAGGLVVTPQLVELDNRSRSKVLTLANRGNTTETYRITIVNYRMDEKGNLHPTETPSADEGFANGLFRYAPRQITLKPGKPQTVRILYRKPQNMKDGEYRSHLLFQQIPEATAAPAKVTSGSGLAFEIKTIFGITIPVIVRQGPLEAKGRLDNLQITETSRGKGLSVRIAREGKRSLRGDLVALANNEEIGRLNNVAVYMSTPHRDILLPLNPEKSDSIGNQDIRVEYRPHKDNEAPAIATGTVVTR